VEIIRKRKRIVVKIDGGEKASIAADLSSVDVSNRSVAS
jgi:hypothetical protein